MTKKVARFFPGKIGSAAPVEGPPRFFLNWAQLRVNPSGPDVLILVRGDLA